MRNGTCSSRFVIPLALAALLALAGGCDSGSQPIARYQVDVARNRAWSLGAEGLSFHDRSTPTRAVPVSLPGWTWAGPPYGCMPDLALGPRGEVVVTSDVLPTLWRIDPVTLEVSVHALALDADTDKDVGFSGLAFSSRHGAYFGVSHGLGSVWRIDPQLNTARKISRATTAPQPCGAAGQRPAAFSSMRDL